MAWDYMSFQNRQPFSAVSLFKLWVAEVRKSHSLCYHEDLGFNGAYTIRQLHAH